MADRTVIVRDFESVLADRIRQPLNFIQVVLGVRQVGKTTGVRSVFSDWPNAKLMVSADLHRKPHEKEGV